MTLGEPPETARGWAGRASTTPQLKRESGQTNSHFRECTALGLLKQALASLFWVQVTFLVTEDPTRVQGRVRREALSPLRFEPYEAVALASGGEVIFTKDQHIQNVAAIVEESTAGLVRRRRCQER